jgi:(p)ppGpp synthase/HD superfamily hydrolase
MLYTTQVKLAMELAYQAHLGQLDKGGAPYIFHPIHLAEQMDTETEITAALLHDVVEDSDLTPEALRNAGISQEVLAVLDLLTHRPGEPYMDYIRRLAPDPIARKIKLADLRHNGDMTRLGPEDQEKVCYFRKKYAPAVAYLTEYPL